MDFVMIFIQGVMTIMLGTMAYLVKKEHTRLEAKDKQLDCNIRNIEDKLNEYKLYAQKEFITKDEFIRAVSGVQKDLKEMKYDLDKKLDRIMEQIVKNSIEIATAGGEKRD